MKHKRLKIYALLLFELGLASLRAQDNVSTTGGNASGSGGTVAYSVGQVVYQTHTGANGSLAEGVQQPYEVSVVTGLNEAKGISLNVMAYPNPTNGALQLKIESEKLKDFSYQLYDSNGKLLQTKQINGNQTSIVMSNFVPATYFLKVSEGYKEVKTFIIVKN